MIQIQDVYSVGISVDKGGFFYHKCG